MNQEKWKILQNMVWGLRARIADRWQTPDPKAALRFATTEAAECLDAYLREQGGFARNHNKLAASVNDELGDTLMMLVTALGPDYVWNWRIHESNERLGDLGEHLDVLCMQVANANLNYYEESPDWAGWLCDCQSSVVVIENLMGYKVMKQQLAKSLRKQWRKHGRKEP